MKITTIAAALLALCAVAPAVYAQESDEIPPFEQGGGVQTLTPEQTIHWIQTHHLTEVELMRVMEGGDGREFVSVSDGLLKDIKDRQYVGHVEVLEGGDNFYLTFAGLMSPVPPGAESERKYPISRSCSLPGSAGFPRIARESYYCPKKILLHRDFRPVSIRPIGL